MGFAFYYRSTEAVDPKTRAAIDADSRRLCAGRTWLSCEPVAFFGVDDDGHLMGACKPNFMPHPDDAAAAELQDLPDGTVRDALDILCRLSRDHGVDWEIGHDDSDGPIGLICSGQADPDVVTQIEAFGSLAEILGEYDFDEFLNGPADDDDDGPGGRLFDPDEN